MQVKREQRETEASLILLEKGVKLWDLKLRMVCWLNTMKSRELQT
jgi:hypothetical protein